MFAQKGILGNRMIEKIKKMPVKSYLHSLQDVRNIGLLAFVVVSVLVTWSGIKVVQRNYDLQKQIAVMRQENEIKKLENSNLALKNQYLETDQYLELVARRQYNKALPGEKLLIVPKQVALAHSVEIIEPEEPESTIESEGPWYERNFNAWLDFFFRKD